jgi:hypothetical protein
MVEECSLDQSWGDTRNKEMGVAGEGRATTMLPNMKEISVKLIQTRYR